MDMSSSWSLLILSKRGHSEFWPDPGDMVHLTLFSLWLKAMRMVTESDFGQSKKLHLLFFQWHGWWVCWDMLPPDAVPICLGRTNMGHYNCASKPHCVSKCPQLNVPLPMMKPPQNRFHTRRDQIIRIHLVWALKLRNTMQCSRCG